ncbi:MAG: phosphodiester glycosidase family protein [bacterium]
MKRVYELSVMMMLLCSLAWAGNKSVYYDSVRAAGVNAHTVNISMNDTTIQVRPAFAWGIPGKRQLFKDFIHDYNPIAQITGPYFGMLNGLPVGDIVIDGKGLFKGFIGSALVIDKNGKAKIIDIPFKWEYSWPGYQMVMQGGVRLVENGKSTVYPRSQGFTHLDLFKPAARTAIGIHGDTLVMLAVTKPIYLSKLAAVMKGIGCTEAMTLDGGSSTGLAIGKSIIVNPGRELPTVLMVVKKKINMVVAKETTEPVKETTGPFKLKVNDSKANEIFSNGILPDIIKTPYTPMNNQDRILANTTLIRYINGADNPMAPRKIRRMKRGYLRITV